MRQIYICDSCHYLFEKADDSDCCPDCGKQNIRPANKQEQAEYRQLRIEFGYISNASKKDATPSAEYQANDVAS